jgi:cytoskeletal protein CcmA (bactofilin family)
MKTFTMWVYRVSLALLVTVWIASCSGGREHEKNTPRKIILSANEIHEGWYFASADEVIIEGTVNGDAYVAGGTIHVDGTINGDLIAAGGQVVITGSVSDNVRVAGGSIECLGAVGKNFTAAGGHIVAGKSSAIGGGILAAGGSLSVAGKVEHEAMVCTGDMSISGSINGNTTFAGGAVSIHPGAKIGGNLKAIVEDKKFAEIADGTVHGTVEIATRDKEPSVSVLGLQPWRFWLKMLWVGSLFVTIIVLVFAVPKQLKEIGSTILQKPGLSLAWGALGIIGTFVLILLLLVTIIGIPLGLFTLAMFLWIIYLSQLSLGVVLAHRLFHIEEKTGWQLLWGIAAGLLVIQVLTLIPYVGTLINLGGLFFGFGAILLILKKDLQLRRTV